MKKRILALLLGIWLLIGSFAGCGQNVAEDTDTVASETTAAETEESSNKLQIVSGGKALYGVVRPDADQTESASVQAALKIRAAIEKHCTESVYITTDYVQKGKTHDSETLEILIGKTNYDETATALEGLEPGGCVVKLVGNKIVVFGYTDDGMANATDLFIELLESGADSEGNIALSAEELNIHKSETRLVTTIPTLDGCEFENFYDPGDDCDEAIYAKATRENFDAYVKKLQNEGYTLHAANDMNECSFATLYNEKYTVNVGFYAGEKKIRIIVEPYSELTLYGAVPAEGFKTVTTTKLTMLGVMYKRSSDGKNENTGASLIIRLADGQFIIIDGGHNRSDETNEIIELLYDQSEEYRASGEVPVIAAWYVTHPHSDHWGALKNKYSLLYSKVTVKNIIYNQLSEDEYIKTLSEEDWRADLDGLNLASNLLKAPVVVPHVGQIYYYSGVQIEILYTYESQGPVIPNDANQMSLIMKVTFTDPKTGEKTVFMATGDGTGAAFRNLATNFGSYLACDIAQIAHHGASTKGDDAGTIMAYKLMQPKTVLWTSGDGAYTAYAKLAYNAALVSSSVNKNFKEVYIASSVGKRTELTMPYTVGSATVTN